MKNLARTIQQTLLYISPWVLLFGLYRHNFQEFFPYDSVLKGPAFFDFFTVIDGYMLIILVFFIAGIVSGLIKPRLKRIPVEWWLGAGLLIIAGYVQVFFQTPLEPVLSTPHLYVKQFIVYPVLFSFIALSTLDKKSVRPLVYSYVVMVCALCLGSLFQYATHYFPGATVDFTGRLVWPFIDFLTLDIASANWLAFFVLPTVILSFTALIRLYIQKMRSGALILWGFSFLISGVVVYLTQSYGAYAALFIAFSLYVYKALPLKKFFAAFTILLIVGIGMFFIQQNSYKYKIISGSQETQFDNSLTSRGDIMRMNMHIIRTHPLLGVGLNQYQSYFAQEYKNVLKDDYNESHFPPHAHNFFLSFWTNTGLLGFAGMLILIIGMLWRRALHPSFPGQFVIVGIMTHGLIDSFYWRQEIAYTVWIIITFVYLYKDSYSITKQ